MGKNSYPQGQIDDLEQSTVQEIVTSLKQLHDRGKPQTDEEIKQRIDEYFLLCQQSSIRPGIESLCLSLHISRTTLFNWNNGTNCSAKCQEYVQSAKAFIGAFIEQAMLGGKISPPSGIFLMKNWLSYKDAVSIEESIPNSGTRRFISADKPIFLGEPGANMAIPFLSDEESEV
ncbi:MAG: DNA-packaging protein [Lachnospiraceae bacterium]|nr:DNA-packaging protein [Lachnospiraceae bacterium]